MVPPKRIQRFTPVHNQKTHTNNHNCEMAPRTTTRNALTPNSPIREGVVWHCGKAGGWVLFCEDGTASFGQSEKPECCGWAWPLELDWNG